MNQAIAVVDNAPRATRIHVVDAVPVLDTGRFEQMYRIAKVMAQSNLIPETLCATYEGTGTNRKTIWLPVETVTSNCFLIVNQAVGWGMDPFAVAQCASVVHGRVCYEGKLIAAVIDQKLGVQLDYEWNEKTGDALGITVRGQLPGEAKIREMRGTVGEWKTTGNGSPWFKQPRMQLAYRGSRDWARLHKPALMLGVYSVDEMESAIERQGRLPAPPNPSVIVERSESRPTPPNPDRPTEPQVSGDAAKPKTPPNPNAPRQPASDAAKADGDPPKPKTPPNPNKAANAPPPQPQAATGPIDFDAFHTALDACKTLDEANAVFDREVIDRKPPLSDDEEAEASDIMREICARYWEGQQ